MLKMFTYFFLGNFKINWTVWKKIKSKLSCAMTGVIKLTNFCFSHIAEIVNEIKQKGRSARIRKKLRCFPFTVLDDLVNFQDVDQETYDNVVNIFIFA